MTKYQIENGKTGVVLGIYEAKTEAAALDLMAQDAGYANYADAEAESPSDGAVVVTVVE